LRWYFLNYNSFQIIIFFLKQLRTSLDNNRLLFDKLLDTGVALASLCNPSHQALVQDAMLVARERRDAAREAVDSRGLALDSALDRASNRLADRLQRLLDGLEPQLVRIRLQVEPAAKPDAIREQLAENCALVEQMERRVGAYEELKRAAQEVIAGAVDNQDPAVLGMLNISVLLL